MAKDGVGVSQSDELSSGDFDENTDCNAISDSLSSFLEDHSGGTGD